MIRITQVDEFEQIYRYQLGIFAPYFFATDYSAWKASFTADTDGEGRALFKTLFTKAAYDDDTLVGFIQYGITAFGFDHQGQISSDVSYCVIRNLYFDKNHAGAGSLLLKESLDSFSATDTVYAFFHYFGMSCFARHGKLFEQHGHIDALLREHGFETEHENVYYSSVLNGSEASDITVVPHEVTTGHQQYFDFLLSGDTVGGCEIHFVSHKIAYLRWIYVNGNIAGQGIGTRAMDALKLWLYEHGITQFDTDTAFVNTVAQHFYEKNRFAREGITRSYYRRNQK